ncbi:hypothetical protein BDZ94DRAFT_1253000, partial [Collybia nuda]
MGSVRNMQGQSSSAAPRQRKRWTSSVKTLFVKILPIPRKSSASSLSKASKSSKRSDGSPGSSSNSKETLETIDPTEPIKRVPTHSSSDTVRNEKESTYEGPEEPQEAESVGHRETSSEMVTIDPWQFKSIVEETYLPKVKDAAKRKELDDQLQNTYKRLLEIEQEISKGEDFGEDFESSIQNRLSMIEEGSEEGAPKA